MREKKEDIRYAFYSEKQAEIRGLFEYLDMKGNPMLCTSTCSEREGYKIKFKDKRFVGMTTVNRFVGRVVDGELYKYQKAHNAF